MASEMSALFSYSIGSDGEISPQEQFDKLTAKLAEGWVVVDVRQTAANPGSFGGASTSSSFSPGVAVTVVLHHSDHGNLCMYRPAPVAQG